MVFRVVAPLVEGLRRRFSTTERNYPPGLLCRNRPGHQVSHAPQVVGRASEGKQPVHHQGSAMTYLAQQGNRLQPAKTFFDALPFLLTDGVARVSGGSRIDGA